MHKNVNVCINGTFPDIANTLTTSVYMLMSYLFGSKLGQLVCAFHKTATRAAN